MDLPDLKQVRIDVVLILTVFTGRKPAQILDGHTLQDDLQLNTTALNALALSLRGYIQRHNPKQTIVAKEIKKKGLKVGELVTLVFDRIHKK